MFPPSILFPSPKISYLFRESIPIGADLQNTASANRLSPEKILSISHTRPEKSPPKMPQPYIIGDTSPFLKRVLVPFWVVRIIVMVINIGVYAFLLWGISRISDYDFDGEFEQEYVGRAKSTLMAITAVVMTLIILCLILDIVSIVKRSRRTLSPRFFLITNVIQTTLWVILFILSMLGAKSALTIGIQVIIL